MFTINMAPLLLGVVFIITVWQVGSHCISIITSPDVSGVGCKKNLAVSIGYASPHPPYLKFIGAVAPVHYYDSKVHYWACCFGHAVPVILHHQMLELLITGAQDEGAVGTCGQGELNGVVSFHAEAMVFSMPQFSDSWW